MNSFCIWKILWQAGERRGATVCIPYAGDECFTNYGEHYVPDGISERVRKLFYEILEKKR